MSAPNIPIQTIYESFLEKFNEPWTNSENININFSDPRNRSMCCATMIDALVRNDKISDARSLFQRCNEKNAWAPNVGRDPTMDHYLSDQERNNLETKINAVCQRSLNDARTSLGLLQTP